MRPQCPPGRPALTRLEVWPEAGRPRREVWAAPRAAEARLSRTHLGRPAQPSQRGVRPRRLCPGVARLTPLLTLQARGQGVPRLVRRRALQHRRLGARRRLPRCDCGCAGLGLGTGSGSGSGSPDVPATVQAAAITRAHAVPTCPPARLDDPRSSTDAWRMHIDCDACPTCGGDHAGVITRRRVFA